jgi:putative transposase
MARGLRTDLPDGFFHVTARGVDGTSVFRDARDRRGFLELLADAVGRHRWTCHAFCLMTTHYHLIVETGQEDLSTGMHRLNGVHAQRFNRRHGRRGHLFGDRFAAWVIETEEHLQAAASYVLENPVRAGICESPADWPWSAIRNVRSIR